MASTGEGRMKLLLTFNEVIDAVSMSKSKIDRLIAEGRFPKAIKIGGNVRFRASDLVKWESSLADEQELIPVNSAKRGRPRLSI